jgi:hypothetical protein
MGQPRTKTINVDASLLADARAVMKLTADADDAEVVERALRSCAGRVAAQELKTRLVDTRESVSAAGLDASVIDEAIAAARRTEARDGDRADPTTRRAC